MLVEIFRRFDTYGDGTISLNRLTRALEKLNLDHQSIDLALNSADACGSGRIDYTKFASWVTGFHEPVEPAGKCEDRRLFDAGSLRTAVDAGEAVLLKASWLAQAVKEGRRLPPREELPPEALWDAEELFQLGDRMLEMLRRGGHAESLPIVSVSLPGRLEEATADQLRMLGAALEHLCKYLAGAFKEIGCPADCGVFVGGCSLKRQSAEPPYEKAVEAFGLWYGHSLVRKILISGQPSAEDDGFAFLESSLSGLLAQHQLVLRLSSLDDISKCKDWASLRKACALGRPPPLTPEGAAALLDSRRFASPELREAAKGCYRSAFGAAAGGCRRLIFARLGWGDEELRTLATALTRFPHLAELFLEGNRIGDQGAGILAGVLPHCPSLREVLLARNCIGDTGAESLAKALPRAPVLQRLELHGNALGEAAAASLASELPAMRCLKDLLLQGNPLGDSGVKALASALPSSGLERLVLDETGAGDAAAAVLREVVAKCPSLRLLHLEKNGISEPTREALREAWRAAGKPERSYLNGKTYPALML